MYISRPCLIDDKLFSETVKTSKSPHEVFITLNLSTGRYKSFWLRCEKLNLDTSHFKSEKITRKKITNEQIIEACKISISRRAALQILELNINSGTNVRWIISKIDKLSIDTKHWLGFGHLKGKEHNWSKARPLNEILIQNSDYLSTSSLKKKLFKMNLLKNECYICCLVPLWQEKKLVLQLDHINGNNRDNRLENLRLLCPNCHSQTETFCAKNKKGSHDKIENALKNPEYFVKNYCLECNKKILKSRKLCGNCWNQHRSKYLVRSGATRGT